MILALSILSTVVALVLSFLVVVGNGMSDAPTEPFQGKAVMMISWIAVLAMWGWYFIA